MACMMMMCLCVAGGRRILRGWQNESALVCATLVFSTLLYIIIRKDYLYSSFWDFEFWDFDIIYFVAGLGRFKKLDILFILSWLRTTYLHD